MGRPPISKRRPITSYADQKKSSQTRHFRYLIPWESASGLVRVRVHYLFPDISMLDEQRTNQFHLCPKTPETANKLPQSARLDISKMSNPTSTTNSFSTTQMIGRAPFGHITADAKITTDGQQGPGSCGPLDNHHIGSVVTAQPPTSLCKIRAIHSGSSGPPARFACKGRYESALFAQKQHETNNVRKVSAIAVTSCFGHF